jgi:pyruvate/2-oxoglutarate/acetoin dehydrogenase E1 component
MNKNMVRHAEMREITFSDALLEALREEMMRDDRVFAMGEDVAWSGNKWRPLWDEFGENRVLNTPISESAMVGSGVGAALNGMRPVVDIMFADLLPLCHDHLVNDAAKVCYQYDGEVTCPLVITASIGATGRGIGPHHSQSLESCFLNVPGLKIVMPSTPYDAKGLLKAAIRDNNPIIFLEHKLLRGIKGPVPEAEYTVPLGTADIKREGDDVTIVASAYMLQLSLVVGERLREEGIHCEVVDLRTLLPLDADVIIESVKKTSRLVTVQESPKAYGYGAEIVAIVAEKALEFLDAPVKRVANPGTPIPRTSIMERAVIPSLDDVITAVKEII